MNQQKICPHCGAQLPDMASFCPHCAQSVTQRREFRPPRRLPRRVLRGALLVLVLGTLALSAYLYTRPKVYDNGAAEVIYLTARAATIPFMRRKRLWRRSRTR